MQCNAEHYVDTANEFTIASSTAFDVNFLCAAHTKFKRD